MTAPVDPWIKEGLDSLTLENRLREVRAVERVGAMSVRLAGRTVRLFSSNDYLGLSAHPEVRRAAAEAASTHGMGPRGASLICGHTPLHDALESALASLKGTEAALLFPTGYQANVGLLSAIADEETTIFSDALNHASIIDGCRLSRAQVVVFEHNHVADLAEKLSACQSRRRVVVNEEIFSMDGDAAPLREIAQLKEEQGFTWVTDSAHSTLVYGPNGGGVAEHVGVTNLIDYQVGTMSKALGTQGGFVATSAAQRAWLLNNARSFIFSTALAVPLVAAAIAAIDAARDGVLKARLWAHVERLGRALGRELEGPIVPVIVGSEAKALARAAQLLNAGIHAPAIRPPTVPPNTCRIRITLSAAHSEEDLDSLIAAVRS